MHPCAHRVAQRPVNRLMPFDQPLALEILAHYQRLEMVAAAGRVANLDKGSGQGPLDHLLQLHRVHRAPILATPPPSGPLCKYTFEMFHKKYRNSLMWQALRGITLLAKRSYHRHSADRTRLPIRHVLRFGSGPQKTARLNPSDSDFYFASNPERYDPCQRLSPFGQPHFFAFAHGLPDLLEMLIRFLQSNFHFADPPALVVTSLP